MKRDKYVGMDVHQSMTVVAVMNAEGKIVLKSMVPTAASPILELIESLSGPLHVTLEGGSQRSGPQSLDSAAAILRWIPRFIMLPKAPA